MDKPNNTLGKHQIEGKNNTDEGSQIPAKKLKADVSTSSSTATNSNTASFAESNSNQINDDHHSQDDHHTHTQDDHHAQDDHHKDSSSTENSPGTMDESAITSLSHNNTALNSGESISENTNPELEDIFQTPVPEHFKSMSKKYAEKARQHPATYDTSRKDTSTLAGQLCEVAKKSFGTTKELSQNVKQSAKDISQSVAKEVTPETVDAIGTIASSFIPGAETVLHTVAEVMRKRKKPDDQQDQQDEQK